jgi:hypothetical protein
MFDQDANVQRYAEFEQTLILGMFYLSRFGRVSIGDVRKASKSNSAAAKEAHQDISDAFSASLKDVEKHALNVNAQLDSKEKSALMSLSSDTKQATLKRAYIQLGLDVNFVKSEMTKIVLAKNSLFEIEVSKERLRKRFITGKATSHKLVGLLLKKTLLDIHTDIALLNAPQDSIVIVNSMQNPMNVEDFIKNRRSIIHPNSDRYILNIIDK